MSHPDAILSANIQNSEPVGTSSTTMADQGAALAPHAQARAHFVGKFMWSRVQESLKRKPSSSANKTTLKVVSMPHNKGLTSEVVGFYISFAGKHSFVSVDALLDLPRYSLSTDPYLGIEVYMTNPLILPDKTQHEVDEYFREVSDPFHVVYGDNSDEESGELFTEEYEGFPPSSDQVLPAPTDQSSLPAPVGPEFSSMPPDPAHCPMPPPSTSSLGVTSSCKRRPMQKRRPTPKGPPKKSNQNLSTESQSSTPNVTSFEAPNPQPPVKRRRGGGGRRKKATTSDSTTPSVRKNLSDLFSQTDTVNPSVGGSGDIINDAMNITGIFPSA